MSWKPLVGVGIALVLAFIAMAAVYQYGKKEPVSEQSAPVEESQSYESRTMPSQEMTISKEKKYTATLETDEGSIVVELFADRTPITVNNFVSLARSNFYDGTIFHRIIKDFMIQGGDPQGNGTGGPGYTFNDEPFTGEYSRGTLAMANAGPNTNGSQFFIMHKDVSLPKNYVIFGNVISGMDAVDAIATAPAGMGGGGEVSRPAKPVTVKNVLIKEE